MSVARFPVFGSLDRAGGARPGTVLIDRGAGTFAVRPQRSRRTYTVSLSIVADIIVERILKAEMREKAADKKRKQHLRRGR
jgi:hypothetical protein